jgi:hypothetical protein
VRVGGFSSPRFGRPGTHRAFGIRDGGTRTDGRASRRSAPGRSAARAATPRALGVSGGGGGTSNNGFPREPITLKQPSAEGPFRRK